MDAKPLEQNARLLLLRLEWSVRQRRLIAEVYELKLQLAEERRGRPGAV